MAQFLTLARPPRRDLLAAPISAFESETQEVIQATTPYSERTILHVLAAMVVLAVLLMSVVKLDRVVSGQGKITASQGTFFVQPLNRAIVTGIKVRVGEIVHKGQVLATLDPTFAQADLKDLQQKRAAAEALVARLTAENESRPYAVDPNSPQSVLQGPLWAQRNAEFRGTIDDFDEKIRSGRSAVARAQSDQQNYQRRLELASEAEQTQLKLQSMGYGRKISLLNASDTRVEMQRMVDESRGSSAQGQHDVASLGAMRASYIGRWKGDVAAQLVTAQADLNAIQQSLAKAAKFTDLSKLVAPANGVVLKIGRANIGSVIDPSVNNAEPLFTLTPLDGPVEAEFNVDAKDIGYIRPGDKVRIKLEAYRFTAHGTASGIIQTISDDSFTVNDQGQPVAPFYKVKVKITDDRLRDVPAGFRLTPGLTMTGEILIGRRTIMDYLFGGALRTGSEAMREPN